MSSNRRDKYWEFDEYLSSMCWCGRIYVTVPRDFIREGKTYTCGKPNCKPNCEPYDSPTVGLQAL